MKNLTATKKSIIAISISLAIILLMLFVALDFTQMSQKSTNKSADLLSAPKGIDSYDSELLTVSNAINKDSYILTNEDSALMLASMIFTLKSNVKEVTHYELEEIRINNHTENLSQALLNFLLELDFKTRADGTCSLIAMMMASDALKLNEDLNLPDAKDQSKLNRNVAILKQLHDISLKYGNVYKGENAGTKTDTISKIVKEFYANNGRNISTSEKSMIVDLRKYVYENFSGPSILSIYNGRNYDGEDFSAHSVALLGNYNIKLEYKTNLGIRKKGTFHAFVICDGDKVGKDGQIGNNYQILIFNTTVSRSVDLVKIIK